MASCPDCRKINEESDKSDDGKVLYPDAQNEFDADVPEVVRESVRRQAEIPNMQGGPSRRQGSPQPGRFQYKPRKTKTPKKVKWIIIGVILFISLIVGLYGIPIWHSRISLLTQTYVNKGGGGILDSYWKDIYTLNGWSSQFFFNKTALIGAIIGCVIMSIPPDKNIMKIIKKSTGRGSFSTKYVLLSWWTGGFLLFYLIGQGIDSGNFSLVMYMFDEGTLSLSDLTDGNIFNAFNMIIDPANVSMIDLFVYSSIVLPIINFALGVVIFRLILNIINHFYFEQNIIKSVANVMFLISIASLIGLFGAAAGAQDRLTLIRIYSVWIAIFAFAILGFFFLVYDKKVNSKGPVVFTNDLKKKAITVGVITIFLLLIPVFASVPRQISLGEYSGWEENLWDVRYEKEIAWTRMTSGIDLGGENGVQFYDYDINTYINDVIEPNQNIISNTRQYDKTYSGRRLDPRISSPELTLADSDIIYVPGYGEYWVASITLNMDYLSLDNVRMYTELFGNVEGYYAISSSTGSEVEISNYEDIFGVGFNEAIIYYGEKKDPNFDFTSADDVLFASRRAFSNNILLETDWSDENPYLGEPDGTLSGLEAFWFTLEMGLTNYALDFSEKSYLFNRNIRDRVQDALLPGLTIDEDPYLVFDRENKKMYYCVSIYTELNIGGYANSPMYRFLGVTLVDVFSGELTWYQNPSSFVPAQDPLYNLWNIYNLKYNWAEAPEWLRNQMRYPECLWDEQMAVHYTYHVEDPQTWYRANDFYTTPTGSEVYYIETDLGEGLEFCGINLVRYRSTEDIPKLAGLYVIRHGENFGETRFYKADDAGLPLLGPDTARSNFQNVATRELELIAQKRFGNILLYPLAGSLYYYIPVYSQTTESEGNIRENLNLAGLINAFDSDEIYYGNNINEAFANLQADLDVIEVDDDGNIEFTYIADESVVYDEDDWASIKVTVDYWNSSATIARDLSLNFTIQTSNLPNNEILHFNVSLFGNELVGYNFSIEETNIPAFNFTIDSYEFYPGEGKIYTIRFKPSEYVGGSGISYLYRLNLFDNLDDDIIATSGWQSISFLQPETQ